MLSKSERIRKFPARSTALLFMAAFIFLCGTMLAPVTAWASGIKVVPSVESVSLGESLYVDIVVEDIPALGLGAVQFRINVSVPGGATAGVLDISQGPTGAVSVVSPLIVGPSSDGHSGIGDFFWNGRSSHGVLVMDNEAFQNGSGLYTFGHTNGAVRPSGSGTVARFYLSVGKNVGADQIDITLSDVMLLDSGEVYPLDSNVGATIPIGCFTSMPSLLGLSLEAGSTALGDASLVLGTATESETFDPGFEVQSIIAQSYIPGSKVKCGTAVDLVLNPESILDVTGLGYADKENDDSGAVVLSWTPSASPDVAGYFIYGQAGNEITGIDNGAALGIEVYGLPNGITTTLIVRAYDAEGNESDGVSILVEPLDDVSPIITVTGVEDGAYYAGSVTPSVTADDKGQTTIQAFLNGTAYDFTAVDGDGAYTLAVTASDEAGNLATANISFVIDSIAPSVSITGVEDGKYYNSDAFPVVSANDTNLNNISITLNGSVFESGSAVQAEGSYELSVTATDLAGNTTNKLIAFHIDKTAPVGALSVGVPKYEGNSLYVTSATQFTFSSSDEFSGVALAEYHIDGGTWTAYEGTFTLAVEGAHTIGYRSVDNAGNVGAEQAIDVVVDNTAPETSLTVGSPKYENVLLFVKSTTEFALGSVDTYSGVAVTQYRIDNGSWMIYGGPFTLSGEGAHNVFYRSVDNLGHAEAESALFVVVDDTEPEVEVVFGEPKHESGVLYVADSTEIIVNASDSGSGAQSVEYRLDGGAWQAYDGAFTVEGEGTHGIEARVTDRLGNELSTSVALFVVDNSAPMTEITVGTPKHTGDALFVTNATIFVLEAVDNLSGVDGIEYRIDSGAWNAYAPFNVASEGGHTIEYRSADNVDNVEAVKSLIVTVDNTAPKTTISVGGARFSGDALYVTSAAEFTLSASDNLSGVASTEYRTDDGEWNAYTGAVTLAGEGGHTISFRSADNLGNVESEQILSVVVDDTPPATEVVVGEPKHENGDVLYVTSETEFTLIAADNLSGVAFTEYRLDEGEWSVYTEPFTLTNEGGHTIGCRSIDNVGNVEAGLTLAVVVDDTAPVTILGVDEPKHTGDALYVTSSTGLTLSASDAGAGVLSMIYRIDDGPWNAYAGPFMLGGEGEHTVSYRSTDNLGNAEAVKSQVLVVDDTAPETSITVGEPRYEGDALYVTAATGFTLSATDDLSGVAVVEYRIDGGEWLAYDGAFTIAAEGAHAIGYRGTDNVGNVNEQSLAVTVDNTPPVTAVNYGVQSYAGGGVIYLTKNTAITLTATDALSGVAVTSYRLNNGGWTPYEGAFTVDGLGFGSHTVGFYSVDNVGNAEFESTVDIVVIGVDVDAEVVQVPRLLVWTEEAEIEKHRAFIAEALAGTDEYVSVVTTKDEFVTGLRSGVYNVAALMRADASVNANVRREMREAANRGMGFILSAWGNNVHPITAEVHGVKFNGSRPMDINVRTMDLEASAISEARTYTVYSRVLKAELAGGEQVGVISADTNKKNGNPTVPVPAVVLNSYGNGKAVYLGFDLLGSAEYTEDPGYLTLFRKMIEYVTPAQPVSSAYATVLVETTVTAHGAALDIRATEMLDKGLEYLPLFDLRPDELTYEFSLKDGESYAYRYFMRLPDESSEYEKTTAVDVNIDGQYNDYETFGKIFVVPNDSAGLLSMAGTWLSEAALASPSEAGKLAEMAFTVDMLKVADLGTLEGIESAIAGTVGVIEKTFSLSLDSSEFRMLMDEYLRILGVYYAIFEGTDTTAWSVSIAQPQDVMVVTVVGSSTVSNDRSSSVAQSTVTLEAMVPDYPRVLVWLNDGCASLGLTENCMRKDLVSLSLEGTVYNIVESAGAFTTELRNDYYTDYLVLGDAEALSDMTEQELMARVYGGRGLISSHWSGTHGGELFGIDNISGMVSTGGTVELVPGEVYTGGIVEVSGAVLGIEPIDETSVVSLTADGLSAALRALYGSGRTLFMGYDLGLSLNDFTVEDFQAVIDQSLNYVHTVRESAVLTPGDIRPVLVRVSSQSDTNVTLNVGHTQGMVLIDGNTGSPVSGNPETYPMPLSAGTPGELLVYVLMPDVAGSYGVQAGAGGASASVTFSVEQGSAAMSDGIIQSLNALKATGGEKQALREAITQIKTIKARNITALDDITLNVQDVLAALEAMKGVTTVPADVIRLKLEEFLGVWQEHWYIESTKQ